MNEVKDNIQKYNNYKEQMIRLKKALSNGFYLEAIFIEYAIMEDRLESALRHGKLWNPKPDQFVSLDKKCKNVAKMAESKKNLASQYFSKELTDSVFAWKEDRNKLIHALLKQSLHTEDLRAVAEKGEVIVKQLCSKTASFKRALERAAAKN